MARSVPCLLAALLLFFRASSAAVSYEGRICSAAHGGLTGPFCSAGQGAGYLGPLDSAEDLAIALNATAHLKEVIVTAESRVDEAGQFLRRFRRAGWGHVLMVMDAPGSCQRLARLMRPYVPEQGMVNCGWYRTHDPVTGEHYRSGFEYLPHFNGRPERWRKWFTTGRAIALGYNVMAVDADSTALDDFYLRVKNPPLSGVNMMSQAESRFAINGGFTYVQNASPNGPVAWIFFEVLLRAIRWSEDCSVLRKLAVDLCEQGHGFRTDDQLLITESMLSSLAGRPVFSMAYHFVVPSHPMWRALHPDGMAGVDNFLVNMSANKLEAKTFKVQPPLAHLACDEWPCARWPLDPADNTSQALFMIGNLIMPHTHGEWVKELGGNPYAPPRAHSLAYRAAYAALRKYGALRLPDPEDPADEELARRTPNETFTLLSSFDGVIYPPHPEAGPWTRPLRGGWVEGAHWTTGRWGHFHTHMQPRYRPAIGHMHVGFAQVFDTKGLMAKTTDHYDWELAARYLGNREHVFYAAGWGADSAPWDPEQAAWDWQEPPALGRVVAYAPGVIHAGLSKLEFVRAAEELARVSLALGAVAAWPAAPCDADWVLNEWARSMSRPIAHRIPWDYLNATDVVAPFGDSLENLQCEWLAFTERACLASPPRPKDTGRGMLAVEFRQLLKWLPPRQEAHKLVLAADGPAAGPPPAPGASSAFAPVAYADLLRLNAERLLQLRPHPELLWLDRLVAVEGLGGQAAVRLGRWTDGCRALRYSSGRHGANMRF